MTISKKPAGRETGNPSPPRLQLQNTLESSLWYANLEEGWRYVMDQRHNGFEHLSSHSTRPLPFSRWLFPSIRCLYFDGYPYAPGSVYCTGTQESAAVLWTQFCNCNNHANNISLGLLFFVCCLSLYALVVTSTSASFVLPLYLIRSIFRNIHLDLGTNRKLFNKSCSSGGK